MRGSAAFRTAIVPGGVLAGPWVKNELWRRAKAVPSLDLRFAENKSLVDATTGQNLITFTRASSGTFVGSDGLIKTATTDTPRFDHNPTTGESLGLLVEEARTNLTQKSQEFEDVYWTKTVCTITANESTAPDGTLTADLWTNTSSPGSISNTITKDTTSRTYTASVWVKGTLSQFTFSIDSGVTTDRGRVQFNLSTNTVSGTFNEGAFTNTSGTLAVYPNGWVRLAITTTTSTGTTIRFRPFFSGSSASVRIWGAQIEEGAFATSYIPTTTATVTRSADVANITGSNFSSFYNQTEGAALWFGRINAREVQVQVPFRITEGSNLRGTGFQIDTRTSSPGSVFMTRAMAADYGSVADPSALNLNNAFNLAGAYKVGEQISASFNGGNTVTSASLTSVFGTENQMDIGGSNGISGSNAKFNGTIRRLAYWPQRLPNSTLQEITR